ncbi:fused MFS/spermidine synthase [Orrella sp. JC864]|uniref:spermidine synthase n=1 Tax=Orrella sp. JC864 TaxID=3120298 RepID=UPI00300B270B
MNRYQPFGAPHARPGLRLAGLHEGARRLRRTLPRGLACLLLALSAGQAAALQVLHTEASSFSPVVVYEAGGERCLTFENAQNLGRQSCQATDGSPRMVLNYTRMMMSALAVQPEPGRILVIGLGGGTLPMALAALLPQASIDTVEIDPAVTRVARQYFGFQTSERVRVHEADGRAFVEQAVRDGRQYDLILLDAFDYNYIPRHLTTVEFLSQAKALLAPAGVLAANTFSSSGLYDRESATYASVFGPYFNARSNNRVIFAVNGPLPEDAALQRNARRWAPRLAPYGVDLERELQRYTREVRWPPGTALLRDGDAHAPANAAAHGQDRP